MLILQKNGWIIVLCYIIISTMEDVKMIVTNSTIVVFIISLVCMIIGKVTANKFLLRIGRILLFMVLIFILVFVFYSMEKNAEEYNSKFGNRINKKIVLIGIREETSTFL